MCVQLLSKFLFSQVTRFSPPFVRHLGGLTPLEKYDRLRKLCCTSDMAKRKEEAEQALRPKVETVEGDECCVQRMPPLLDIRCKNALILGGGSDVGFETAKSLLSEGIRAVVIADINQCTGMAVTKKLCSTFGTGKAAYLMCDIRSQSSVEMAFKEVYERFDPITIFVNMVGVYNETPQCWDKMVRTNLNGCVRATLLAYKYLSKGVQDECHPGSVIANVSSYGSIANIPSMPIFSAASNGINGLTSSFGQEAHYSKTKIRCVTVCPAFSSSGCSKNFEKNHYDRQWAANSLKLVKCQTKQTPEFVGKAIATSVKYGLNGSVYVVKDGKYYRYVMPDYMKIMRQEAILL